MAKRRTHVLLLAVLLVCSSAPEGVSAQRAAERLAAAKSLTCTFATMSTGDWKSGTPSIDVKPSTFTVGFDDIDTDDGTAKVIGPFGPSDIVVRMSTGTLHFLQSFREGPLYATTIFPYESRPGHLRAVHTRHEFTEVSLPGFTSRPEQYVGDCEISR